MPHTRLRARAALLFSTLIWGTSFVICQRALVDLPVFHLMAFRFAIALAILLPLARGIDWNWGIVRDGALLGVLLFGEFALQSYGLLGTTPSRSAFLTGLSVVMVPFLAVLLGRTVKPGPAIGSVIAAAGLWVLFRPAAGAIGPAGSHGFGWGDGLTLASALAFAVYVLAVEAAVRRQPVRALAIVQFGLIGLLAAPSLLFHPPARAEFTPYALFAILVLGVLATAVAFLGNLYAQRHLAAVEAGVILSLEPVFAAAFSVALGVERWTLSLALGGALVVAAMLTTELWGGAEGGTPPT
ncbi:MAG TPA: DMT family transporter [Thermoanaerobaculia bacterium]|nr:DMT family transporter [Thermoanaerobaculia bacterium]